MNRLEVSGLGRKYFHHWVIRKLSFSLSAGETLLVTGPNGSGKSTLMRLIAGQLSATEGEVKLFLDDKEIPSEQFYRHLAWTGPYFDLYSELTLKEAVDLHFRFKDCLLPGTKAVIEQLRLGRHAHKTLSQYSSGMLHRVKVGLALYSASSLLLLDEASANLDDSNTEFIFSQIAEFQKDRMLIFVSNNSREFERFENRLDLSAGR